MKKVLFVLLSLIIVGSLVLTACAPSNTTEEENTAEEETVAEEEEMASEEEEEMAPEEEEEMASEEEEEMAEEAEETGTTRIVFAEPGAYSSLDPFVNAWHATPTYAVFSTLVHLKPDLSEYVGYMAESWTVAEDNLSVDFKLREDITFTDGTEWNAEAAKWIFDMFLDPELAAPAGGDLRDAVESVEIVDDYTIKMNLFAPYAPLLYVLSGLEMPSPTAYQELGADQYSQDLTSAGYWKVEEIIPDVSILYSKNEDFAWAPSFYENQGPVQIDELLIKFIGDEAVTYAALETGEVHIALIPPQYLADAKANENIEIYEAVETTLTYLGINNEMPPFDDINVRQAMAYAVNRDEVVLIGYEGTALPTYGPLAWGTIGFNQEIEEYSMGLSNDVEYANQLLEDAGYVMNEATGVREKDGMALEFSLMCWPDPARQRASETLQAQLAEIGIKANIEIVESTVIKEATIEGSHELIFWLYGYLDPMILTYTFKSSRIGASNRNRVNDAYLDELLDKQDQNLDAATRLEDVKETSMYLVDKRYHIPLLTQVGYIGYRADLVDVSMDVLGGVLWGDTKLIN